MAKEEAPRILSIGAREVRVTHPSKPVFSGEARLSKLDLVTYYLSVPTARCAASATARSCSSAS